MTLDQFELMVRVLTGEPLPPPPAIPGTLFKAPDFDDDGAPALPGRIFPRRIAMTRSELQRCAGPEPPKPG